MQSFTCHVKCSPPLFLNKAILAVSLVCFCSNVWGSSPPLFQLKSTLVTLDFRNDYLKNVFFKIQDQTEYNFSFGEEISTIKGISIRVKAKPLSAVLQSLTNQARVSFHQVDEMIIVKKVAAQSQIVPGDESDNKQIKVSGKVTDAGTGEPLPGVNVVVKGTAIGVTTDADGQFILEVDNSNAVLIFSFIGYLSNEMVVGSQTNIKVSMEPDVKEIDEVVVVGYGTTKAKDLTGSVATLNSESFNKGLIATPDQLLQGRTAGVTVTPSSGEPGGAVTINIRGTSAIRGNNDPLYVIDGVPVTIDAGLISPFLPGVGETPRNPLSFLNPADIAGITILKDASSAAIYGSRGANGVILITTKKGASKNKWGNFTYSANVSSASPAKQYDLANGSEFISALRQANIDLGSRPENAAQVVAPGTVNNNGFNTDWQGEIFRNGISTGHMLGWDISKEKMALRLSGSYDNQQGIIKRSELVRWTGRVNFSQKLFNDKLQIDVIATLANVKNGYTPPATESVVRANPTFPVYNADGSFYSSTSLWYQRNVTEMLNYLTDTGNTRQLLSNTGASYTIIPGLVFKSTLGYNNSFTLRKTFADPRLPNTQYGGDWWVFGTPITGSSVTGNGNALYQHQKSTSLLTEQTLTWDKKMGRDAFNAVVGYSFQDFILETFADLAYGVKSPAVKPGDIFIKDITNFANVTTYEPLPSFNIVQLQSFYGRVNYSVKDKYLFTATARMDGSSKLGASNRYGIFPAFAVKWKLLNEEFAKALSKTFSDLSFRANWGKLGSQDGLGAYDAIDLSTQWKGQTRLEHQGNKDLKWEVATTTGLGLDWGLANRRLSGTIDYFYTLRDNLIFYGPVPGGFSASANYFSNLPGYVLNSGLEFSFLAEAIQGKNFNWNINYNMTFYQNSLHNFHQIYTGAISGQGLWSSQTQTLASGHSLFAWYLPVFTGLDGNGLSTYEDNGAKQFAGSPLPTFTAGLTNNFTYKNWNLSVFFNTSRGFYVYNNTANAFFNKVSLLTGQNITRDVLTSRESPLNSIAASTRYLEKGDFIRLSNASLGYMFSLAKSFVKSIQFTLSGQNLWLFTKYSGLDPEVNINAPTGSVPTRGVDYLGYPKARTVTVGINAGF